jgi:hypothetical protein
MLLRDCCGVSEGAKRKSATQHSERCICLVLVGELNDRIVFEREVMKN